MLERLFHIQDRGSTLRIETLGGVSTFLTMCYILFVNPAILSQAGVPFTGVAVATALAAGVATIVMGLVANLPFALASGLGINAVVAFDIVLGQHVGWPVGMAAVVIEGLLALVLVIAGLREAVVHAVPNAMKLSIGVGIGIFIAFVGLQDGGIVVSNPATKVALGNLTSGPALIALAGIFAAIAAIARGMRGALLIGIAVTTVLGLAFGILDGPSKIAEWPGSAGFDTIGKGIEPHNLADALTWALVPTIFALFMTDFFDTVGTAVAVGTAGGLTDENGDLPQIRRVLLVDSAAAAFGGAMGVSSVTTYVESGAGVSEGARTGFASIVTGALFLLSIFFVPLISVVGQSVPYIDETTVSPAIAPALVMVGYLMIRLVQAIDWTDAENAVPSFLIIAGIPLTFSIAAGIGLGVLAYVVVMISRGHIRAVHPLMWLLVPLFLAYFADDWLAANVF
ncbi:MAG: Xanthine/uracil/vitamin permease [Solirubrobacterales bacterium]|jgi:AGZA family xanthine/uracil permease-like MFS transporter|nr:Xanthine/uracil/vitamin permease [Solirubrobacterales bacterium]